MTDKKIIGNNQKAYLPGRYIGECSRTVYDIMNYAIKNDITSLAMLVDFKKAFDSVSHSFIKNAIRKFKFNKKFIHWINTLLSGFKSRTLVNGCLGDIINLERGCRQGDPVAGYLKNESFLLWWNKFELLNSSSVYYFWSMSSND